MRSGLKWHPESYRTMKSYMEYFQPTAAVFKQLLNQNPIVPYTQVLKLRHNLEQCERGQKLLLHMGDCAEPFEDATPPILKKKGDFLQQCKKIMQDKHSKQTVLIGRIAGQYAKPRSTEFVNSNGKLIHNYKGDNVNSHSNHDRTPSSHRLMQGFKNSSDSARYLSQKFPEVFYSHEGLIVPYEAALTRPVDDKFYCSSAHMLWIGERTRQLDGAHVEFFRGIENPVGIKVSAKINGEQFHQLVRTLNPQNQSGKLLVIARMGHNLIQSKISELIAIKKNEGLNLLFVTDPMHGNTYQSQAFHKLKTRNTAHILQQIQLFKNSMLDNRLPYGFSFEATWDDVTECHGLAYPETENQMTEDKFRSKCDPRLNSQQMKALLALI